MADSFETLFTVNDKNYTECKTGFQVFATSGSQKAVIKAVSYTHLTLPTNREV